MMFEDIRVVVMIGVAFFAYISIFGLISLIAGVFLTEKAIKYKHSDKELADRLEKVNHSLFDYASFLLPIIICAAIVATIFFE